MTAELGLLRDIQDHELSLILSWRNAPSVRANMYTRHKITFDEHLRWWEGVSNREDQRYYIYENDGHACGVVGFTQIQSDNGNASWAFYASPQAPRGTGSRMEFLALELAFGPMFLNKLYCEVLAFNNPVINLHKKFGFILEGTFRAQHRVDDAYIDVIRLGILQSEWEAMREIMYCKLTHTC